MVNLAMLAASPHTSGAAVAESLKFLSKALQIAEKEKSQHITALTGQIATLSKLPSDKVGLELSCIMDVFVSFSEKSTVGPV